MQARHDRQRSMWVTTSSVAGAIVLQHLLDQVDAPARRIEFVAEQHIGRARRLAEAAMHAGAQNLVGHRDVGIGELREGETGLHHTPAHIRPGLSTPLGSKLSFTRLLTPASAPFCGSNTSTDARGGGGRANERGVAAGRSRGAADGGGAGIGGRRQRGPDQAAGPVVEELRAGRQLRRKLGAARGRGRDPPQRPVADRAVVPERRGVADAAPELPRIASRRSAPARRTAAATSSARPCGA